MNDRTTYGTGIYSRPPSAGVTRSTASVEKVAKTPIRRKQAPVAEAWARAHLRGDRAQGLRRDRAQGLRRGELRSPVRHPGTVPARRASLDAAPPPQRRGVLGLPAGRAGLKVDTELGNRLVP